MIRMTSCKLLYHYISLTPLAATVMLCLSQTPVLCLYVHLFCVSTHCVSGGWIKLGAGSIADKSVSFEKSVSFSDEPPDMNSPKQHSPQHGGELWC